MQGFDQSWLVFALFLYSFFPKYNSQIIFETDFVVPVGEKTPMPKLQQILMG